MPLKKTVVVKLKFKFTASQGLLKKEERFRQLTNYEGRKIGNIAKRAAIATILVAFVRRFQSRKDLGLPLRLSRGRFGKKTTRKRQESDRRRRLSSLMEKLNEAYKSGSTSRIRSAEAARTKATDQLRGTAFSNTPDAKSFKEGGLFRAFVDAEKKFPGQRKAVMDILRSEKNIQLQNKKGVIEIGIGDITLLDAILMPSATHELESFTETPFVHMWRQMEFGSGVFAKRQTIPGNLAGTIRGAWWYGRSDRENAGVEFAGSKPGNIIFAAASIPYEDDAQAFFEKFNKLLVEAIGV